jgi:hypothetical protein
MNPGPETLRLEAPRERRVRISPHRVRGPAVYERCGDDRLGRGLYLDLPPWGHRLFEVQAPAWQTQTSPSRSRAELRA